MNYIKFFDDLTINDIDLVGGKNASLGEMIQKLDKKNIHIPNGFATTSTAYWHFINSNNLKKPIKQLMDKLTTKEQDNIQLKKISLAIRTLIESHPIPLDLQNEIIMAYQQLQNNQNFPVAVRSSATAEDLPTASFAGQQDSFLNIRGTTELLKIWKKCISSLFTARAIVYRISKGFDYTEIALSVGIQQMVEAQSAGVAFTLDTESGFKDVVFITSAYGLGENIVQGKISPDEFYVHKPLLEQGFKPLLSKKLGSKQLKAIYAKNGIRNIKVPLTKQQQFSISNAAILELARISIEIENLYTSENKEWTPMDIEWVQDKKGKLFIVQARPETIHRHKNLNLLVKYRLTKSVSELKKLKLLTGQSVGQQITTGPVRILADLKHGNQMKNGDILVTQMTDPDWVPLMKKAGAIVTDRGGRTCHAAIVSRELGIPAIVGTQKATTSLKNGQLITVDCSQGEDGYVYEGQLTFHKKIVQLKKLPYIPTKILLNIGQPNRAFSLSFLPVQGVGLARVEFIISDEIKIHPLALLNLKTLPKSLQQTIKNMTSAYKNPIDYFVDILAEEVATIAAAFWPKPVIVRLSDFKSNEYRNLIGGSYFEPIEENPMIGLRGAARYYSDLYQDAFKLECQALKMAREIKGFKNIKIMIPFVRTVEEAERVTSIMKKQGLSRKKEDLELVMMCEIPSNVLLLKQFSKFFDGFSIGSNDLTQLTLGIDRDASSLAQLFDERNEAVKLLIEMAIKDAHKNRKFIGICGQAPSDFLDFGRWLIKEKIDSISLNPDAVIPFIQNLTKN